MSTVLITGGSGFLGKAILSHLLKNTKDDVYTLSRSEFPEYNQHIQCDLLDLPRVADVLEDIRPEMVFHTAGIPNNTQGIDLSPVLRNNIEGTNNLLSHLMDCPRFVFASSCTIYGEFSKKYPPNWMTIPRPISLYSVSKLAGEHLVRTYQKGGWIDGVCIRIPTICGLGATHGLLKDLFSKIESDSSTLNLWGISPGSIKPFQRVEEVAKLFCDIAYYKQGYEDVGLTVLAGNTDSLTVLEIAEMAMNELGRKKEIVWNNVVPQGDNNEIYLNPCFHFPTNSHDSILQTIKEYKESKKLAKE